MEKTIIVAADDSPAALQAARLVAGYRGERSGLAVVALNVQPRPLTLWPEPTFDARALDRGLLDDGARQLEPACKLLAGAGVQAERAVRLGIPAEGIAEEALRRGAEAIVMGTRGHGALGGFALGSVALRVVHRAQTPVVLVQPDARLPAGLGERARILLPFDGSAHAARAAQRILEWKAWLGEVEVDVVHACERLDDWGKAQAERATRAARALLYAARIPHRVHEAEGQPAAQILRLAGDARSDFIVMGSRGLGAIHHALIGSTALKVAHAAALPVALVA